MNNINNNNNIESLILEFIITIHNSKVNNDIAKYKLTNCDLFNEIDLFNILEYNNNSIITHETLHSFLKFYNHDAIKQECKAVINIYNHILNQNCWDITQFKDYLNSYNKDNSNDYFNIVENNIDNNTNKRIDNSDSSNVINKELNLIKIENKLKSNNKLKELCLNEYYLSKILYNDVKLIRNLNNILTKKLSLNYRFSFYECFKILSNNHLYLQDHKHDINIVDDLYISKLSLMNFIGNYTCNYTMSTKEKLDIANSFFYYLCKNNYTLHKSYNITNYTCTDDKSMSFDTIKIINDDKIRYTDLCKFFNIINFIDIDNKNLKSYENVITNYNEYKDICNKVNIKNKLFNSENNIKYNIFNNRYELSKKISNRINVAYDNNNNNNNNNKLYNNNINIFANFINKIIRLERKIIYLKNNYLPDLTELNIEDIYMFFFINRKR